MATKKKTEATACTPRLLGIEGGGTHTVALMADLKGSMIHRLELGPGNLRLLSDPQLHELLKQIKVRMPCPNAIGIGMAGARTSQDRNRILRASSEIWPDIPCIATHDLDTALAASEWETISDHQNHLFAKVLILSGTGSCCFGKNSEGKTMKVGGWGHILGDSGSAYDIGLTGARLVIRKFDECGIWPRLGVKILEHLQLNEPDDLIAWVQTAKKDDVASLALPIFYALKQRDPIAHSVLIDAAKKLTANAITCANRLGVKTRPVCFVFAGGVLTKQNALVKILINSIKQHFPQADFVTLAKESVWGAVSLAKTSQEFALNYTSLKTIDSKVKGTALQCIALNTSQTYVECRHKQGIQKSSNILSKVKMPYELIPIGSSPTEQRNPRSLDFDKLSIRKAVDLMIGEERFISEALFQEADKIEKIIRWVEHSFKKGGRLFYVGAGTSGRLGVLDASECPPTFRTPPEQVQGIIAGGQRALWQAVEGAEDDAPGGAKAIEFRQVNASDIVIGIAASGRTPFVWGALLEAKMRGAKTVLLAFNPTIQLPVSLRPSLILTPKIGPELLTGSTRLKSGTATKLILNMITTLSMVQMGKVASNLMVDLNPSNIKLRDRAIRIICEITGVTAETAQSTLEKNGWIIKKALKILRAR